VRFFLKLSGTFPNTVRSRYIKRIVYKHPHMVVAPKAGEAPVKPIDVWANQTQKRASLLGLDSPLFGATTIAAS